MEAHGMTPAQVAKLHGISRTTVYRLIDSGALVARRVGFQYRIDAKDAHAVAKSVTPDQSPVESRH